MFYLKRKLFADGGVLRDMGGGGGGGQQPTQSTSYNTNVPEYARPYVENMLQSTQKQIYNDDMTSFRPYTPYSTDVNNYFADFSPAQKYAQSETANMQTPGQYGTATGMTGLAGLGSLGLAGQMAGAGQQFNQMAQDPRSMQGFMSPYMQNVVDYQKSQALRDYGIGTGMRRAQAVGQGAFGGSRQAIVESEAERALGSQLQGIAATGSQKAFEDAQRQQQFGAQLGLQGQQAGLQGLGQFGQMANQLASIGGQEQASNLARLQAQYGMGKEQQTMEQNKINQAISNYATAQQYPFMQLGIMNSMLRGLPLQQTTTATYQQQPSTTQQLAGLAGAGMSYFGGGRKEGGIIEMKEGGTVPGYKYGDLISDPQLQSMSQGLSPQQLQGRIADPQVNNNERDIFQSTQQAQQRMASNPMAAQQMAQAAPPPQMAQAPSDAARMGGIAQAGGDMFNTMGYAGGGIIAFAGEGPSLVDEAIAKAERDAAEQDAAAKAKKVPVKTATKDTKTAPKETAPASREDYLAQTQALMEKQGFKPGATADEQAYADMVAKQQAGLGEATSAKERANMAKAFLKMGANARGFLPGAIEGAESYLTGAGEIAAGKEAREMALAEARSKYSAAQRARAAGDIASSDKLFDEARKLESQANIAKNRDATSIRTAEISSAASKIPYQMQKEEKEAVRAELRTKLGREPTMTEVIAAYSTASNKTAETTVQGQIETALAKDDEYKMLGLQLSNPEIDPTTKAKIIARRKEIYNEITSRVSKSNPQTAETAVPVQNQDGTVTIPGKGTFKKLPNGNYAPV
jgi:hypothetical protein